MVSKQIMSVPADTGSTRDSALAVLASVAALETKNIGSAPGHDTMKQASVPVLSAPAPVLPPLVPVRIQQESVNSGLNTVPLVSQNDQNFHFDARGIHIDQRMKQLYQKSWQIYCISCVKMGLPLDRLKFNEQFCFMMQCKANLRHHDAHQVLSPSRNLKKNKLPPLVGTVASNPLATHIPSVANRVSPVPRESPVAPPVAAASVKINSEAANKAKKATRISRKKKTTNVNYPAMSSNATTKVRSFDARFKELMDFKKEFGHCNVPNKPVKAIYKSLGEWCCKIRCSYRNIKLESSSARRPYKLTEENIKRLEGAGFQWDATVRTFEKHFNELLKFREEYGHCNVPVRPTCKSYKPLGNWCKLVRHSYWCIQNGKTPKAYKLTENNIKRLDAVGFKWKHKLTFDERFEELLKFKEEYGHCNVPVRSPKLEYKSLSHWCTNIRRSYKCLHVFKTPALYKLSEEQIVKLAEVGFRWSS